MGRDARLRGATRPCCVAACGDRSGRASYRGQPRAVEGDPLQLIGLMSGVITGVTAGAMGFMGASALIAGFLLAALRAGFFFEAFFEDFFLDDFLEDFFLDAFFLELFFFATRFFEDFLDFLEDFFFAAFLDDFFFAAFFFAAMFNSFGYWTDVVVRVARVGSFTHYQSFDSHRTSW